MRPKVDFSKIVLSLGFKQENQGHLVALGPKGGEMRVFNQDNITFRADFSRRYSGALGPSAETIIAEDTETLRDTQKRLKEAQQVESSLNAQREKQEQETQERQRLET